MRTSSVSRRGLLHPHRLLPETAFNGWQGYHVHFTPNEYLILKKKNGFQLPQRQWHFKASSGVRGGASEEETVGAVPEWCSPSLLPLLFPFAVSLREG